VVELVTSFDVRMEALGGTAVFSWHWDEYGEDVLDDVAKRHVLDAGRPGRRTPRRSGPPRS
jgi:hypothetical protein